MNKRKPLGLLVLLAVMLQALVIYASPLNRIFHTVPIPADDLLLIVAFGSAVLWAEEARKLFVRVRAARAS